MPKKRPAYSDPDEAYVPSPALSPEARESQLINLAIAQAEKELRAGTASSQIVCHYLKLATQQSRLETEILKSQNEYLKAKTDGIKAASKMEETYEEVLNALKRYGGLNNPQNNENIFRTE